MSLRLEALRLDFFVLRFPPLLSRDAVDALAALKGEFLLLLSSARAEAVLNEGADKYKDEDEDEDDELAAGGGETTIVQLGSEVCFFL